MVVEGVEVEELEVDGGKVEEEEVAVEGGKVLGEVENIYIEVKSMTGKKGKWLGR